MSKPVGDSGHDGGTVSILTLLKGAMTWLFPMYSGESSESSETAMVRPASTPSPLRPRGTDPLNDAVVYRLKRDALMILSRMNHEPLDPERMKRLIVFMQHQLVMAAIRDPAIDAETKTALLAFQDQTVRDSIEDRRGAKRRGMDGGVHLTVVRKTA